MFYDQNMSDAQKRIEELHKEIKEAQHKKKELSRVIKEGLESTKEYLDIMDEMKQFKAKKKQIEISVRAEYSAEFNELDDVKTDIKDTKQVLSDLMWNELMKNNKVEVMEEDVRYVPEVKVTLKKDS
mgnify:CR=1 FL=1